MSSSNNSGEVKCEKSLEKRPVTAFFFWACGITWIFYAVAGEGNWWSLPSNVLGRLGPLIAAVLSVSLRNCEEERLEILNRALKWRVWAGWYLIALTIPWVLRMIVTVLTPGNVSHPQSDTVMDIFILSLVFGGGQEIGWRGFALPRLLKYNGPFISSLAVGILWTAWHLPRFVYGQIDSFTNIMLFSAHLTGLSVICTALFLMTEGSVPVTAVFVASVNSSAYLLPGGQTLLTSPFGLYVAGQWAICLVILIYWVKKRGKQTAVQLNRDADNALTAAEVPDSLSSPQSGE